MDQEEIDFLQIEQLNFKHRYAGIHNVFGLLKSIELKQSQNNPKNAYLQCVIISPKGSEVQLNAWKFSKSMFDINITNAIPVIICNVQPTFLGRTTDTPYLNFDAKSFLLTKFNPTVYKRICNKIKVQVQLKQVIDKQKC